MLRIIDAQGGNNYVIRWAETYLVDSAIPPFTNNGDRYMHTCNLYLYTMKVKAYSL